MIHVTFPIVSSWHTSGDHFIVLQLFLVKFSRLLNRRFERYCYWILSQLQKRCVKIANERSKKTNSTRSFVVTLTTYWTNILSETSTCSPLMETVANVSNPSKTKLICWCDKKVVSTEIWWIKNCCVWEISFTCEISLVLPVSHWNPTALCVIVTGKNVRNDVVAH